MALGLPVVYPLLRRSWPHINPRTLQQPSARDYYATMFSDSQALYPNTEGVPLPIPRPVVILVVRESGRRLQNSHMVRIVPFPDDCHRFQWRFVVQSASTLVVVNERDAARVRRCRL